MDQFFKKTLRIIALFCLLLYAESETANQVHSFQPQLVPFTTERLGLLRLPPGFHIGVFAQNLGAPRMIAVNGDGWVYITVPKKGEVLCLRDTNSDGRADVVKVATHNLPMVHGITLQKNRIFLAAPKSVWSATLNDGVISNLQLIIGDLPSGGRHPLRTAGVGPEGSLYISIGSSCNACEESDSLYATIAKSDRNGKNLTVFASGLRNTIGFGWHPQTAQMWGMDQGVDERGDNTPPEELNLLEQGHNYGWPYVYGQRILDTVLGMPQKTNLTKEELLRKTTPPVLTYQAHSSPIGLVFYGARQFPSKYHDGAFVAFHGSWNRKPAVGYKICFIRFENGQPKQIEDFVTGFLSADGKTQFGRPAGVAVTGDGSLLFSDDANGVVYRVWYQPLK